MKLYTSNPIAAIKSNKLDKTSVFLSLLPSVVFFKRLINAMTNKIIKAMYVIIIIFTPFNAPSIFK
jgi:hypothetical protein